MDRRVRATHQKRRLGYHSQAGLEPGTFEFSTPRINHHATRGMRINLNTQSLLHRKDRAAARTRESRFKGLGPQRVEGRNPSGREYYIFEGVCG
jgi:hypothetical protein